MSIKNHNDRKIKVKSYKDKQLLFKNYINKKAVFQLIKIELNISTNQLKSLKKRLSDFSLVEKGSFKNINK